MSNGPLSQPPPAAQSWHRIVAEAPEPGALPFLGFYVEMAQHLIAQAGQPERPYWPPGLREK